jgi:hypothetical protein
MKSWLFVGAKVVCVDNAPRKYFFNPGATLVVGATYTVSGFTTDPRYNGALCVILAEQKNPHSRTGHEVGYQADRFRPVLPDTSKQIEAMRSLMLDATVRGKVDA